MDLHTLILYKEDSAKEAEIQKMRDNAVDWVVFSKNNTKDTYASYELYNETCYYFKNPTLQELFRNIGGHNFTSLKFLDGTWDSDIINYCLGRIRG